MLVSAAAAMALQSSSVVAMGFSNSTWQPFCSAATVISRCVWLGVTTSRMSNWPHAIISSGAVKDLCVGIRRAGLGAGCLGGSADGDELRIGVLVNGLRVKLSPGTETSESKTNGLQHISGGVR